MPDLPLLSLVMMVKNEVKSLRAAFESVRGAADTALVLDTGSTDGTQALARKLLTEMPGELVEEPFVDFATTRNRSLDLATGKSVFGLLLSGDETLVGATNLRQFCERMRDVDGPEHGVYFLSLDMGSNFRFSSARLVRLDHGWRYVGAVHEFLTKPGAPQPSLHADGCSVQHDLAGRDHARKILSATRDLDLLRAERKRDPSNARTVFYLAQTLEDLGRPSEAHQAYKDRIALGGWQEEVYEARFRLARTALAMGEPWERVQALYLEAFSAAPHRAEPLFEIALHWQRIGNHALAFLFGQRAMQLPHPEHDLMPVNSAVYSHLALEVVGASAWYVGEYAIGEAALRRALAVRPGAPELLKNLEFYNQREAALTAPKV